MSKTLVMEYNNNETIQAPRNGGSALKEYVINFSWDEEAFVWIAISNEIPLALESESLDQLMKRVSLAAPELLELNGHNSSDIMLTYNTIYHERILNHG